MMKGLFNLKPEPRKPYVTLPEWYGVRHRLQSDILTAEKRLDENRLGRMPREWWEHRIAKSRIDLALVLEIVDFLEKEKKLGRHDRKEYNAELDKRLAEAGIPRKYKA